MSRRFLSCVSWVILAVAALGPTLRADGTAQGLPFAQAWSNTGLITVNDDWSGVPGIVGYRGDGLTGGTAVDPQTVLADGTTTPIDVNANQTNTAFATGGVSEFEITNPTVALQGSGTARAPFILLNLDTTGQTALTVSYNLRDIDVVDNAIQPLALQYRVGSSGTFTNIPAGFVADATTGPGLATLVTPVNAALPSAADNQPLVQVRIITTDAVGSDEWVGIDDISVTGTSLGTPVATMGAWSPCFQVAGACAPGSPDGQPSTTFTFTADATAPSGLDRLEWDFDGDGAVDQTTPLPGAPTAVTGETTTHVYGLAGSFRPQVRAVDVGSAVGPWDVYDIAGVPLDLDVVTLTLAATMRPWFPCFSVAGACAAGSPDGLAATVFRFTADATAPSDLDRLEWDFDGDGTVDETTFLPGTQTSVTGVTSTHAYGVAGSFLPQVRAVETSSAVSAWDPFDIAAIPVTLETVVPVAIHDIQGPGPTSPLAGTAVATTGIVTGVKVNGFFIQEPDAGVDADPTTSEGVFVFTGGPAPGAAAVGNEVVVSGTVVEFVPSADPGSPPFTEIGGSPVTTLISNAPLPAAVTLTAADTNPAGGIDQLERYEGMRVAVPSLTVVAPTMGSIVEATATATSNGVFYGVITGVARPFREPGVEVPDALPSGSPCCVPRFDANPERLRVDADGQLGAATMDVGTGAVVSGLVGPLDYAFRTYTILPDPASPPAVAGGPSPRAVPVPVQGEVTVASFNLERFFDTVNDPAISEPVLTGAAFTNRLAKASLAIRDLLRTPDVLGVAEVENLATLQALRDRVNADAVTAGAPDPAYEAYLMEGNDIGGIDVGFLVRTADVAPGLPRVEVNAVVQEGAAATYINPNTNLPETLFDRPPLRLDAVANGTGGSPFPLMVVMNHLRSLNGIDDPTPNGSGTEGARVRAKRAAGAEFLANVLQARQMANPDERLVVMGDFNAFEFSDGYADVMGTLLGAPAPPDQVVRSSPDLVNPNLTNLTPAAAAAERYSYVFDGSAQSLDHVLVNGALVAATSSRRVEHARLGADFPETSRNDPGTAVRLSDHDAVVAFLRPVDAGASFYTVAPCRAYDTRRAGDGPGIRGHSGRTFTLAGRCLIPPSARAVALNVAVTGANAPGYLRLYATGSPVPTVSAINYGAGQTRANNAIVSLSALGELTVFCNQGPNPTTEDFLVHVILDVVGYFE